MALINRFTKKPAARSIDEDDELRDIASRRMGATAPAPKQGQASRPSNAPMTTARAPLVSLSRTTTNAPPAPTPKQATTAPTLRAQPAAQPTLKPSPSIRELAVQRVLDDERTNARGNTAATITPTLAQPKQDAVGTTRADAHPVATSSAGLSADEIARRRAAAVRRLDEEDRERGLNNPYGENTGSSGIVEKNRNSGPQTSAFTQIGSTSTDKRAQENAAFPSEGEHLAQNADEARRQAAIDEARRRAEQDRADGGGMMQSEAERESGIREDIERGQQDNRGVGRDESDIDAVTNIRTGSTNKERDDDMVNIARQRLDAEQARERGALSSELAANRARDLMETRARAGLAGMGLGGATSAQLGDQNRAYDRSDTLAMSNLGRTQRNEARSDRQLAVAEKRADADTAFTNAKRTIVVNDAEDALGLDVDGDGLIAGMTEEQYRKRALLEDRAANNEARPRLPDDVNIDDWRMPDGRLNERVQQGVDGVDTFVGSTATHDLWIGVNGERFAVKHFGEPHGSVAGG